MTTWRLQKGRILPAIAAGAAVGAAGVALTFNLPHPFGSGTGGAFLIVITVLVALVIWAAGLAAVGGPLWVFAERSGRRSPGHAIAVGLGATFVTTALLLLLMDGGTVSLTDGGRTLVQQGVRTPYGLWVLARDSGLFALLGGLVALVVWRIAYQREAA